VTFLVPEYSEIVPDLSSTTWAMTLVPVAAEADKRSLSVAVPRLSGEADAVAAPRA
jgi:hypothetical protein